MNLPLAPLIALVAGGLAALGVAMIPVPALEALVMDSGLPSILAAAEPPLGLTARLAVALGAGAFVGAFMWLSAFILLGSRGLTIGGAAESIDPEQVPLPILRRADAHPDAPPRPPLLATRDLGRPFLEVRAAAEPVNDDGQDDDDHVDFDAIFPPRTITPATIREPAIEAIDTVDIPVAVPMMPVPETAEAPESHKSHDSHAREAEALIEQDLPIDFDQPLSAFDPEAIPAVPKSAPVPLAPLRRTARPSIFDESERFEIFELTPPVHAHAPLPLPLPEVPVDPMESVEPAMPVLPPRERIVRPETDASVHALLERLERGVAGKQIAATSRAQARQQERGLEEALVTLRNLARRTA